MKLVVAALAALLAAPLAAQTVDPNSVSTSAATAPAVSADTAPPVVDLSSSAAGGAAAALPPPPTKPAPPPNPIRVKLHKEAADWDPISVKAGGDPEAARSYFSWRQHRGKKGAAAGGEHSKAKAVARLYKAGDDKRLVISVFPDALKKERKHIELRYLIIAGYLEKVQVVAVTAADGGAPLDDARMLEAKGIDFQEDSPASGAITISAIDARPSRSALNAGELRSAAFAESELNPKTLGLVSVEYAAKGVSDERKK